MQYITNTSKGGVRFIAENLVPIYGNISDKINNSSSKCIVTHYDRDLAKVLVFYFFGIQSKIKVHIVHVNPVNLFKFKYVVRSAFNILIYKIADILKWEFIFISRENYANYHRFLSAHYIANPILENISNASPRMLQITDNLKFVNMGRFDFQKNQRRCLDFIAHMEKCYPSNVFEFHFYGDGEYLEEFKELVSKSSFSEKIHLKEWSDNVKSEMENYDIYLQSSLWEGLPTIVVEALDSGLRVISFPLSSAASLLPDSSYFDAYFDFGSFISKDSERPNLEKYLISESLERHQILYEKISLFNV